MIYRSLLPRMRKVSDEYFRENQNTHFTFSKFFSENPAVYEFTSKSLVEPNTSQIIIQGAAERTPRFGRGIASGGERVQWWGARRRTAVYVPFSVYTMAWSGEHRAFIVEEFIKNGGSPVATQRAFRIRFALGRRETVPDKKTIYRWVSNFRQTGSALKL